MSDESLEDVKVEECNCPKGAPRWVVTFGDMMSLLLCFFVLLLSFSTTDIIKYKQLIGSMKDAFGLAAGDPDTTIPRGERLSMQFIELPRALSALVSVRAKSARLAKTSSDLEMESGADWLRLKVPGDALFDSGEFTVKPGAKPLLDQIGDLINEFDGRVIIEGHTDGNPPTTTRFPEGSYLGNYELGALRAVAVLGHLVRSKSVDVEKLVPITFGEVKPRETNEFMEGRAKNRRVEFEFRAGSKAQVSGVEGEIIKPE